MRVIGYNADMTGCGYYRIIWPYEELKKLGHDIQYSGKTEVEHMTGKTAATVYKYLRPFMKLVKPLDRWADRTFARKQFDVVVFQRWIDRQTIINALYFKSKGVKIVYEIDDYLFNIDKLSPAAGYNDPKIRERIMKFMVIADAITVSTPYLARLFRDLNSNIYVYPNTINPKLWDLYYSQRREIKPDGKIRIGWAGSKTHFSDFIEIKDVLVSTLKHNPNVILKIVGFPELIDILKKDFEPVLGQIEREPWKNNMFDYPMAMLNFDIGIIPLKNTKFNKAKSNLKWLEYSALGIPTIATSLETYKDIENGITGILTSSNNNYTAWSMALKRLINNKTDRENIGAAARERVINRFSIQNTAPKLWQIYGEINAQTRETTEKDDLEILNMNFAPMAAGVKE